MKFRTMASLLALGAAVTSTPAAAQDRDSHFDGPYVSGTFGTPAQKNDGADTIVFDTNDDGTFDDTVNTAAGANAFSPGFCGGAANGAAPDGGGCAGDRNGLEYSARIGLDKRFGNIVAGVLFEASKSEARDYVSGFSTTPASYTFSRKLDHALSLRGRVGFTPGGGALFYATGGGSYAKIDHDFATSNTANAFEEFDSGKRVWGWQAGGGAEIMLTDNISLGAEYLYSRYDDDKYYVRATQGTAPATNPFVQASAGTNLRPSSQNFDFHSIRGTLSFQF